MGANTRDIRRRIKSVKNTAQITKAMQMVASSKMRRAQQRAVAGRPYALSLAKMMEAVQETLKQGTHPLLRAAEKAEPKELVLVISTDKGLCGALNTNLLRVVAQFDPAGTKFVTVGRKGAQYLARTKRELVAEFAIKETFTFVDAKQVSKFCVEQFLSGAVSKVTVVYSDFINALRQEPRAAQLLPLEDFSLSTLEGAAGRNVIAGDGEGVEFKFEPTVVDFLDVLLPHFIHFRVYQMILESRASEHSARMVAMKNATDNAKALIKELTLEYNKIRQASITTEILEIATAQMALA